MWAVGTAEVLGCPEVTEAAHCLIPWALVPRVSFTYRPWSCRSLSQYLVFWKDLQVCSSSWLCQCKYVFIDLVVITVITKCSWAPCSFAAITCSWGEEGNLQLGKQQEEKAHDFLKVARKLDLRFPSDTVTFLFQFLQLGWYCASLKNTSPLLNNGVCMKEVWNLKVRSTEKHNWSCHSFHAECGHVAWGDYPVLNYS